jgi:hypothetical protein
MRFGLFHLCAYTTAVLVAGLAAGEAVDRAGTSWAGWVGAPIGWIVGLRVGWLPARLLLWGARWHMTRCSLEEIQAYADDPRALRLRDALWELRRRGLEVDGELDRLLQRMASGSLADDLAWVACMDIFPDTAACLLRHGYRPGDPVVRRAQLIQLVRAGRLGELALASALGGENVPPDVTESSVSSVNTVTSISKASAMTSDEH